MNTRQLFYSALSATLALAAPALHAQAWPTRNISIVVGFTPGGNVDGVARIYAPALAEALGQNVIIENRAGAGGS
ncbi:MAG: ABC transporter substrate-binding protein, partial [Candidatus Parcubacteria bacterium]|nr:ABC transporter substrate-binding protein [Burkholderiales bacterium]